VSIIIAVDFDNTLALTDYPAILKPNRPLINYLINKQRQGDKLILWTCRCGEALDAAVEWCTEQGLIFDAVNDNLPEQIELYGENSRKIYADMYIDDKNCSFIMPVDW
jgi:hypothetical protein